MDPLQAAVAGLLFLTISRYHQEFPVIASLRPALVLAAGALGFAFLNPRYISKLPWIGTLPARVVLGIGVSACLSAVFGISLGASARYILEYFSKVLILAYLIVASIRTPRDLLLHIWAYVLSTAVLIWMAFFVYAPTRVGPSAVVRLHNLATYDSNDLCVLLLVGLGMSLVTFQASARVGKLASVAVIFGIGATVARSGSRGGFLGLAAFGLAFLLLVHGTALWKRLVPLGAILAALVVASPAGYWEQMQTMLEPKADYNWNAIGGRRQLAERGVGYMLRYPVFGLGIHNFSKAEGTISEMALNRLPGEKAPATKPPHNSYVEIAADMGVPGLILWLVLVFGGGITLFRVARRLPARWKRGTKEERLLYFYPRYAVAAYASFALTSFFVSFAYRDAIYVVSALTAGYLVLVQPLVASRATRRRAVSGRPSMTAPRS